MQDFIYKDNLVAISKYSIIIFNYYFPTFKEIEVNFSEIEKIEVKEPSLITGKYRYWGTGDFTSWYPKDFKRSTRDKIFFLYRRYKRIKIGFSVENSQEVISIFKSKHLIA
jgi:hypothetical protein